VLVPMQVPYASVFYNQRWMAAAISLVLGLGPGLTISLTVQMFTEKECLVTIDRFLWQGGIQKCDIMAKFTRKEHN